MTKKPNLSEAMRQANGQSTANITSSSSKPEISPKNSLPPSREGKKGIAGYFDPAVSKQLRQIALDEETTVQVLLQEAINDLFLKKGKPPIA